MFIRIMIQDHNLFAMGNRDKQKGLHVKIVPSQKVALFISPEQITRWSTHNSIPE